MTYRPDIDGLRAIAVLAVLFFHAGLGCGGGYIGVDVFFVISGFLITGLILKDCREQKFRIVDFWERRIRRILPALTVVTLASLIAGWFLLLPEDFKELGQSVVAQVCLCSNVFFWTELDYFGRSADVKPLLHTWSLAVEEQFYLLFPPLVVSLYTWSRRLLVAVIAVLFAISLALSIHGVSHYPSAAFYLLHSRAWELLLGSMLAVCPVHVTLPRGIRELLSGLGLAAILVSAWFYEEGMPFPGIAALVPCAGAALLIWVNSMSTTVAGRMLALPPFVFVGLISYSLYLWHWPVIVFSRYWIASEPSLGFKWLILVSSFALAVLSWKFVETPFRSRQFLATRRRVFEFAGFSLSLLLILGASIHLGKGVPDRIPLQVLQFAEGAMDHKVYETSLEDAIQGSFSEFGATGKDRPVELLLWGDSHAMAVSPALDALCKKHSVRGFAAAHSGQLPLPGFHVKVEMVAGKRRAASQQTIQNSIKYNECVVEYIRHHPVKNVLIVGCWQGYLSQEGPERVHQGLLDTVRLLQGLGTKVWIMRMVPNHRCDVPRALAGNAYWGGDTGQVGLRLADHLADQHFEDQLFNGVTELGATVLDPVPVLGSDGDRCRVVQDGRPLFWDSHHLTTHGAMVLRPLFEPIFSDPREQIVKPAEVSQEW